MPFPDLTAERRHRGVVLGALFGAVFVLLFGRLFALQIVEGERYADLARRNLIRPDPIPAPRGDVLDRRGRLLAGSRVSLDLALEVDHPDYRRREDIRAAVEEVAASLGVEPEPLVERALRHRRLFAPVILAEGLDPERLGPLFERLYPIPGLRLEPAPRRWYPHGGVGAHLLGYVGEAGEGEVGPAEADSGYCLGALIGRSGVERRYERLLRGLYGSTFVTVDALGRKTDLFPRIPPRAAVAGNDLVLAIDLDLQTIADSMLAVAGAAGGGHPGAVIALDPWTGEVLACASAPGYDPNRFAEGLRDEEWAALQSGAHPLLNRTIQAVYPPGSTFKIVTTLAGLHEGWLRSGGGFSPCHGSYRFGSRTFRCWKPEGHGGIGLWNGFAQSCDVFYYQIGRRLGLAGLLDFAGSLHLDRRTGIDLPEEAEGLVPTLDWYRKRLGEMPAEGNVLNLAIGQGELLLTPIAIAAFVSAVVTDGWVREPRVALRATRPGGEVVWEAGEPRRLRQLPVPDRDRELLRSLLEETVAHGTGARARVEGVRVGGKTGTAQNPHGNDHALFVGVAPIEDPRMVAVAVVERGGHGSSVAAPIIQKLIETYLVKPRRPAGGSAGQDGAGTASAKGSGGKTGVPPGAPSAPDSAGALPDWLELVEWPPRQAIDASAFGAAGADSSAGADSAAIAGSARAAGALAGGVADSAQAGGQARDRALAGRRRP